MTVATLPANPGRLRPCPPARENRSGKHYTNAELQRIRELWGRWRGQDRLYERIAAELGRDPEAVREKATAIGLRTTADGIEKMNLTQIAKLLGKNHTSVLGWVRHGLMRPYVEPHGERAMYALDVDSLWAWMAEMRSWHLWEVADLRDLAWREHFGELRRDWLRVEDAGRLLSITPTAVNHLYGRGLLPAAKPMPSALWFNRAEVEAYRLRSKPGSVEMQVYELAKRLTALEARLELAGRPAPGYPVRITQSEEVTR